MNRSNRSVFLLAALLLGGCAAQGGALAEAKAVANAPAAVAAPQQPPPSALEVQAGLQIAQVGVTAQGGLVDVRFKVLDAARARTLLGNPANAPLLMAGDSPPLAAPHHALKGARFANGQVFFILFPNARGSVQPGVPVTVALGNTLLGPVTAQ
jgi:hypothetical protein